MALRTGPPYLLFLLSPSRSLSLSSLILRHRDVEAVGWKFLLFWHEYGGFLDDSYLLY